LNAGWPLPFRIRGWDIRCTRTQTGWVSSHSTIDRKNIQFSDKNEPRFYHDFFFPESAGFGLELAACKPKAKRETI
jgi:hypothetical protein